MVQQVQVPHSVVPGKKPLPTELEIGGLALNLKDYSLYAKGYDGVVFQVNGVVEIEDDLAAESIVYPTWVKVTAGNARHYTSSSKLKFNPSTGVLSAVAFEGSGAALTGVVKPSSGSLPPPANDLASVITLANGLRAALISAGLGS